MSFFLFATTLTLVCFTAQDSALAPAPWSASERARILQHSPLPPLAPDPTNAVADDPRAAHLGQQLFFDTGLSASGRFACSSCHSPTQAFTDGKALFSAMGQGQRNTPTLWNVAYQRWFFWDGRADTLWSQALKPIENPLEMDTDRTHVAQFLHDTPELAAAYATLFGPLPEAPAGDALDRVFANTGKALAAYERKLVTRTSPFDRYVAALRADDLAAQARYPEPARRGLALFTGKANCRTCHPGPLFSDREFHNIGVPVRSGGPDAARLAALDKLLADPFRADGAFSDARTGEKASELAGLVRSSETWGAWRTPSLRNVARTPPYMHQGQFATLRDVLHYYSTLEGSVPAGHHGEQVLKPLHFESSEIDDLVAFLETLSDDQQDETLLRKP